MATRLVSLVVAMAMVMTMAPANLYAAAFSSSCSGVRESGLAADSALAPKSIFDKSGSKTGGVRGEKGHFLSELEGLAGEIDPEIFAALDAERQWAVYDALVRQEADRSYLTRLAKLIKPTKPNWSLHKEGSARFAKTKKKKKKELNFVKEKDVFDYVRGLPHTVFTVYYGNYPPVEVFVDNKIINGRLLDHDRLNKILIDVFRKTGNEFQINLPVHPLDDSRRFLGIVLLDKSPQMFEGQIANGLIGINRAMIEMEKKDKVLADVVMTAGLYHGLCREASGHPGDGFESGQTIHDAYYLGRHTNRDETYKKLSQLLPEYFRDPIDLVKALQLVDHVTRNDDVLREFSLEVLAAAEMAAAGMTIEKARTILDEDHEQHSREIERIAESGCRNRLLKAGIATQTVETFLFKELLGNNSQVPWIIAESVVEMIENGMPWDWMKELVLVTIPAAGYRESSTYKSAGQLTKAGLSVDEIISKLNKYRHMFGNSADVPIRALANMVDVGMPVDEAEGWIDGRFEKDGAASAEEIRTSGGMAEYGHVNRLIKRGMDAPRARELLMKELPLRLRGSDASITALCLERVPEEDIQVFVDAGIPRKRVLEILVGTFAPTFGTKVEDQVKLVVEQVHRMVREDMVGSLVRAGMDETKARKMLYGDLFESYDRDAIEVAEEVIKTAAPEMVGGLTAGQPPGQRERIAALFFERLPLIYGREACVTVQGMKGLMMKGVPLDKIESLFFDAIPKQYRWRGDSLHAAKAVCAMSEAGLPLNVVEEFCLVTIPKKYPRGAARIMEQVDEIAREGCVDALVAAGVPRKRACEILLLEHPKEYGDKINETAKAARVIAAEGYVARLTAMGFSEVNAQELMLLKIPKYGSDAGLVGRAILELVGSSTFTGPSERDSFVAGIMERLPAGAENLDKAVRAFREARERGVFSNKELLRYIDAADEKRPLDVMLLDRGHASVFDRIEPFMKGMAQREQKDFVKNVFLQVPRAKGVDSNGMVSHQQFSEIIQLLGSLSGEGTTWREKILNSDIANPAFVQLRKELLVEGKYLNSWKQFSRLRGLANMILHGDMLRAVEKYLEDGSDDGKKLYDYYEFLIMHTAMQDYDALRKMISDPEAFLDLKDKNTPEIIHDAKKPSRLLELAYIDIGARELIDGLILGKFDHLQALEPFSVEIGMEEIDVNLRELSGGALLAYLWKSGYASQEELKQAVRAHYEKELNLSRQDSARARYAKQMQLIVDEIQHGENLHRIIMRTGKTKLNLSHLTANGIILPRYKVRMLPKSEPQSIMTGNEAPTCMEFGSGKNNIYMFNLNTVFVDVSKRVVDEKGNERDRILATSVVTVDRRIPVLVPQVVAAVKKAVDAGRIEDLDLSEVLGKDFLDTVSKGAFIACDNVEGAAEAIIRGEKGVDFDNVVKAAYKKYFEGYLKKHPRTGRGRRIERGKVVIGTSYSDFLRTLEKEESNYYVMQAPVGYSDKRDKTVKVLDLNAGRAEEAVELNGVVPLSYEDTLVVAYIENATYRGTPYKSHLAGVEMELMGAQYNEALRGDRRKNLSLGYFENGKLLGYVIAYVGLDKEKKEELVYISDIAVVKEARHQGVGAKLLTKLFAQDVQDVSRMFRERYHKDIKVLFQSTTTEEGSYWLFMPREGEAGDKVREKQERLRRLGLEIEQSRKLPAGQVEFVMKIHPLPVPAPASASARVAGVVPAEAAGTSAVEIPSIKTMLDRAMEGNMHLQTVLGDLGSVAPVSAQPKNMGSLKMPEENRLDAFAFDLSDKGRAFFNELFKIDSTGMKVSLATLIVEENGMAIPYAFVLEDPKNKTIYHLQILALGYEIGNDAVKKMQFPPSRFPVYEQLYRKFGGETLPFFWPGYQIQGAIFNVASRKLPADDAARGSSSAETSSKMVHVMYLTQPSFETPEKAYLWENGEKEGGAEKNKDIIFSPHNFFHQDFMEVLEARGKEGAYRDRQIGVIGTGQGADIIELLLHRPRRIKANDIMPLAVMVSKWNVGIAQQSGVVPADIPVEIVQGSGIEGIGDPDVVVWNSPAIKPDGIIEDGKRQHQDFADAYSSAIFYMKESEFREFLSELAPVLNAPSKSAILRLEIDPKLWKSGEGKEDAVRRYLSQSNLDGGSVVLSRDIWNVAAKSGTATNLNSEIRDVLGSREVMESAA